MHSPDWVSVLYMTLALVLIAGQFWRNKQPGWVKNAMIWVAVIAVVALLYDLLGPKAHPSEQAPPQASQSKSTDL